MSKIIPLILIALSISLPATFLVSIGAFAAHPLITDDTGTQGAGKFQIEVNGEYVNEGGNSETVLGGTLSAGALENVDVVLGVPYVFLREEDEAGDRVSENGLSDISLEVKWRFYENEGLGFAFKPGITFATGNEDKGLGDGKPSYSLFFITTKKMAKINLHLHLGYIRNREELCDIWHYSLAVEYAATKNLNIVGNIGGETNPDKESNIHPLFLLSGVIYKVTDSFDVDFGVKTGLSKAEADYNRKRGRIP